MKRLSLISFICLISSMLFAQVPGGVTGTGAWIRADANVTTSGTNISAVTNQFDPTNNFTGFGSPQLSAGNVNFNPAIIFSGSNYLTSDATVLPANSNYTKFVVFKYDGVSANNIISSGVLGTALYGKGTITNLVMYHNGDVLTASNAVSSSRYYLATAGFESGAANGTFIQVDGSIKANSTISTGYSASAMQLGASDGSSNLTGRIAETVVFTSALGAASTSTLQVESYLGLKYGITLGHNYLASNGTTVTYPLAGFGNNVAGLGRDDNSALYQKQSQSINTTTSQVVMALGAITATNQTNSNTIAADKQFLIWGNDNGSVATAMPVSGWGNVNSRLTRVWKLQNTNSFSQQVTVYFPTSGLNALAGAKYLMYNTSTTLAGGGTELTSSVNDTINGIACTGFRVSFPATNTLYFSFGSKAVYPGNVSTGSPSVWVKADNGLTVSGTNVTSWANQVNSANNFTGTANPQLTDNTVNFNPTVSFTGANYLTSAAAVPAANNSNYTKIAVFRNNNGGNLLSAAAPGTSAMFFSNQAISMFHGGIIGTTATGSINPGRQYLGTMVFSNGTASGSLLKINGNNNLVFTTATGYTTGPLHIGAYNSSTLLPAGSNMAEAVVYNSALSATKLRQIESYMALKYGITLRTDYLASDSITATYYVSSFGNNIAGIGRDDSTALSQLQSQSGNEGNQLVMAVDTIAATTQTNTGSIGTNLQFLVWGDDMAPGYTATPAISQKRLTRIWKLQNTNAFSEQVTVYYPVNGLNGLGILPTLVYSSTAAGLSDGTATIVNAGGIVTFNGEGYKAFTVTFPTAAIQYFSFAAPVSTEVCNNGIDDDLDGYIDQYDTDCIPAPTCVASDPLTNFGIRQEWVSTTANALAASVSPTVADLDGDGLPEILTVRAGGTGLTYFKGNGSNASKNTVDYSIQLPVSVSQSTMQAAVADIDRDGIPEVITVGQNLYVYVFNNVSGSASVYKYRSATTVTSKFFNGSPRVVDIDEDGIPEIVVGLDVFRFNFGEGSLVKVITGSATAPSGAEQTPGTNNWGNEVVVIDILPLHPGKEIIAGSQVFGVNLVTSVTTVLANLSTIAGAGVIPANNDGPTAVADLDNDGNLDIAYISTTSLVIWDPVAGVLKMKLAYPGATVQRGMPCIANIYDEKTLDGKTTNLPEVIFTSARHLLAFNLNKTTGPVWDLATADNSGETGVTAFDLNGDGVSEIIYNDEINIRVINGNTTSPANVATFASGSATWMEHPIVADVDGDSGAEFACVTNGNTAFTGMLRVFGPAIGTSAWQGTRKLWNGRGYRSVNVNDDLTIPVVEQDNKLQYPDGLGFYPLNVFNCQIDVGQLNPSQVPASELTPSAMTFDNSDSACTFTPSAATLQYIIANNGAASAPAGTPIRFYRGNPTAPGAVRLVATDALAADLPAGASVNKTVVLNVSAYTAPYTIYAVVNDDGSRPIPFTLPVTATNVKECNYSNNLNLILVSPIQQDYGNLSTATWPSALATIPYTNPVWLGVNAATNDCATNAGDPKDGLGLPSTPINAGYTYNYTVTMNAATNGTTVHYRLWFDWNNDGDFTNDNSLVTGTDNTTMPATYAGSAVTSGPVTVVVPIKPPYGTSLNYKVRLVASDAAITDVYRASGSTTVLSLNNGEVEDYDAPAVLLPIRFGKISAEVTNCNINLAFETLTEDNNKQFEVEYSTNSNSWQTLTVISSSGSSTVLQQYHYVHLKPASEYNYYRIKQVDKNGNFSYSSVVRTRINCAGTGTVVSFPNPVKDKLQVMLPSGMIKVNLKVLNAAGLEVAGSATVTGGLVTINTSTLPKGVYVLQVVQNGKALYHQKIIKD